MHFFHKNSDIMTNQSFVQRQAEQKSNKWNTRGNASQNEDQEKYSWIWVITKEFISASPFLSLLLNHQVRFVFLSVYRNLFFPLNSEIWCNKNFILSFNFFQRKAFLIQISNYIRENLFILLKDF